MKEKYLIAFDTNTLRHTHEGGVIVDEFKFGKQFDEIVKLVQDKNLSDCVHFVIPEIVFKELIEQKVIAYEREVENICKRLDKIAFIVSDDVRNFKNKVSQKNYKEIITKEAENYLKNNKVIVIKMDDVDSNKIFRRLIEKLLRGLPPFSYNPNAKNPRKDSGFKDAVAFETLKEYCSNILTHHTYTGIYFITKDEVFKAESLKGEVVHFKYGLDIKCESNSLVQDILIKNSIAKQLQAFTKSSEFRTVMGEESQREISPSYDYENSSYSDTEYFDDYDISLVVDEKNFEATIHCHELYFELRNTDNGNIDEVMVFMSVNINVVDGIISIGAIDTESQIEKSYNPDYYADMYIEQMIDEARGK
jgi:hypothetical protein